MHVLRQLLNKDGTSNYDFNIIYVGLITNNPTLIAKQLLLYVENPFLICNVRKLVMLVPSQCVSALIPAVTKPPN